MASILGQLSVKQFVNITELRASTTVVEQSFSGESVRDQKASANDFAQPWWMTSLRPFIRLYQRIQQRRKERQMFKHLMSLDDCFLDDIGINRSDVVWAMQNKDPSACPSAELERIACETRAAWIQAKDENTSSPADTSGI